MVETPKCRHCSENAVSRPRGLCWSCFYTPGVRELYGPLSKYGVKGLGLGLGVGPPVLSTPSLPGSDLKMRVMQERLRRREDLHHIDDGKYDVEE